MQSSGGSGAGYAVRLQQDKTRIGIRHPEDKTGPQQQDKTKQDKTKHTTRQDKFKQDRTRPKQDKTRPQQDNKTRQQDKTRQ